MVGRAVGSRRRDRGAVDRGRRRSRRAVPGRGRTGSTSSGTASPRCPPADATRRRAGGWRSARTATCWRRHPGTAQGSGRADRRDGPAGGRRRAPGGGRARPAGVASTWRRWPRRPGCRPTGCMRSADWTTPIWPPCWPAPPCSPRRPAPRVSGCRCWRRWPPACRWSARTRRRWSSWPAAPGWWCRRDDPVALADALGEVLGGSGGGRPSSRRRGRRTGGRLQLGGGGAAPVGPARRSRIARLTPGSRRRAAAASWVSRRDRLHGCRLVAGGSISECLVESLDGTHRPSDRTRRKGGDAHGTAGAARRHRDPGRTGRRRPLRRQPGRGARRSRARRCRWSASTRDAEVFAGWRRAAGSSRGRGTGQPPGPAGLGADHPAPAGQRLPVDVIHSPHYTMPLAASVPVVVTLHDATFFSDRGLHLGVKGRFFRAWTRTSLRRAAVCVVPSRATARRAGAARPAPTRTRWWSPTTASTGRSSPARSPRRSRPSGIPGARRPALDRLPRHAGAAQERAGAGPRPTSGR